MVSAVIIHTLDVGLMQSDSCAFALFQKSSKLNFLIGEISFVAPLELLIGLRKIFKTFGKVYSQQLFGNGRFSFKLETFSFVICSII